MEPLERFFYALVGAGLVRDRDYVVPDDIKLLAVPVLAHRVVLSPSARMRGMRSEDVINDLLNEVAVPGAVRA